MSRSTKGNTGGGIRMGFRFYGKLTQRTFVVLTGFPGAYQNMSFNFSPLCSYAFTEPRLSHLL